LSSAWVQTRILKDGTLRFSVRYRIGGRDSPVHSAGTFRTIPEAASARDYVGMAIAGCEQPRPSLATHAAGSRQRERVYVAVFGDRLKIGVSVNPEQRCRSFHADAILGIIPGGRALERELHDEFRSYQISGEWFHDHLAIRRRVTELLEPLVARDRFPIVLSPAGEETPT
jgi:hypothetical protein